MIEVLQKEGQRTAACAASPQSPQPTQEFRTVATGSFRIGSGLEVIVREGQPFKRIQEWSPVQVSGSTPKRSRTTRFPSLTRFAINGRSRRVLLSVHSLCATMTLGPNSLVVSASLNTFFISLTLKVFETVFAHSTPIPRTARSIGCLVDLISLDAEDESRSCPPVAALYALSTTTTKPSLLLNTALPIPLVKPLCQKPPSPIKLMVLLSLSKS